MKCSPAYIKHADSRILFFPHEQNKCWCSFNHIFMDFQHADGRFLLFDHQKCALNHIFNRTGMERCLFFLIFPQPQNVLSFL